MASRAREVEDGSLMTWLLNNRRYIRQIRDRGGSYSVAPPKEIFDDEELDGDDEVVVLPADVAGQLGIQKDPIIHVYTLPLEGEER